MKMIKENKFIVVITSLVTILPMIIGLVLWNQLPDVLATHFDSNNVANGWSSKAFAVFGLPGILLLLHLVCIIVTSYDPKFGNISGKMRMMIFWIIPGCSLICAVAIYTSALNIGFNSAGMAGIVCGILFMIIGNYLPKCKQNYTVGIKLPWTLDDEENWNSTHRFSGKVWVICGIVMFAATFLTEYATYITFGVVAAAVLIPAVYSFVYYKRHNG